MTFYFLFYVLCRKPNNRRLQNFVRVTSDVHIRLWLWCLCTGSFFLYMPRRVRECKLNSDQLWRWFSTFANQTNCNTSNYCLHFFNLSVSIDALIADPTGYRIVKIIGSIVGASLLFYSLLGILLRIYFWKAKQNTTLGLLLYSVNAIHSIGRVMWNLKISMTNEIFSYNNVECRSVRFWRNICTSISSSLSKHPTSGLFYVLWQYILIMVFHFHSEPRLETHI